MLDRRVEFEILLAFLSIECFGMEEKMKTKCNPILYSDFPDPDIIRVGDTYYMASTTMHFMPGCDILRSYDLMNWEFVTHAYGTLEDTPGHRLEGGKHIYGQGMWAPSFRYHEGIFYLCFTANDTHKTYLMTARNPAGPWRVENIEGFYHDSSLFFDDDGKVYIVYGNTELYLTQLRADLKGPLEGGLHRRIVRDKGALHLGYEGSHLYKKDGRYYLFTCHIPAWGNERKTEDCFIADSLEGEFRGKCIIDDDMGFHNLGVAQGGMVDTPEGDWYLFMFQDRGAVGRVPLVMPLHFDDAGYPTIGKDGKVPVHVSVPGTRPDHVYQPLNGSDDFLYQADENGRVHLKPFWQFNHNPIDRLWSVTERQGAFRVYTEEVCDCLPFAHNVLTQRSYGPACAAWVTVDGSRMKDGDYAGICAWIGGYGAIALTKDKGDYYLVMFARPAADETVEADPDFLSTPVEYERIPLPSSSAVLRVDLDFKDKKDTADFFYEEDGRWKALGISHRLIFKLDHFTGCRFGLFAYATRQPGGHVDFMKFRYRIGEEHGQVQEKA